MPTQGLAGMAVFSFPGLWLRLSEVQKFNYNRTSSWAGEFVVCYVFPATV